MPLRFNSVKPSNRKIEQVIETKIAGEAIKVKLEIKRVSIGPKKLSTTDWLKELGKNIRKIEPNTTDKIRAIRVWFANSLSGIPVIIVT